MQAKVNQLLEKEGLCGGNKPIGVLQYGDEVTALVPAYCAVFETVGDMRLSTNLF
jgi:hypothetical protein